MPVIIQRQNDIIINKYEISENGLTIGRSVKNDLFLEDPSVSQFHAKVETKELKDGQLIYFIVDLESTNQTIVNNQSISQHLLSDQDVIEIGLSNFKYIDENSESLAATKEFKKSWIPGMLYLKN